MTIFERLDDFLKHKDISFNKVSALTGISPGLLSKGLKKLDASLGSEKIIKLLEYFPDLSAEWLLREEGSMLKETGDLQNKGITENCSLCKEKDRLIESYKQQIVRFEKDIEWYQNKLG